MAHAASDPHKSQSNLDDDDPQQSVVSEVLFSDPQHVFGWVGLAQQSATGGFLSPSDGMFGTPQVGFVGLLLMPIKRRRGILRAQVCHLADWDS